MELDPIDKGILRLLQEDAKLTSKEIAARMGLTVTPTYERIKRLEQKGIISRYVALVDKEKVNRKMVAYCNISVKEHSRGNLKEFEEMITRFDEVMECYCIAGMYDYLLKVVTSDMAAYQDFILNKLAIIDGVGNVQSSFVMREVKYETAIRID